MVSPKHRGWVKDSPRQVVSLIKKNSTFKLEKLNEEQQSESHSFNTHNF